jgi:PAS domain S-box-containing protein
MAASRVNSGFASTGNVSSVESVSPAEAEVLLADLAAVFYSNSLQQLSEPFPHRGKPPEEHLQDVNEVYRALVEQIPAVVFMAYLDRGIGEAYVSPQIEAALGFSQEEWLEDPVRWFHHIHPEDKQRWSVEAAQMFLNGSSLESAYRVIARDGKVVWFQCVAKMIRRKDGRPWLIHGVAFDITALKQTEETLQKERNVVSAILDTVGALVVVLDSEGRIVRLNRAGEQTLGYLFSEVKGKFFWHLFSSAEEAGRFRTIFDQLGNQIEPYEFESPWAPVFQCRRSGSFSHDFRSTWKSN